ncbi:MULTISPECIES: GntR family transcriptional regulator [unclassified Beijerinckia]|uniref:GntR family transcriptional regulator n=1 Tax=unclassified Beijerinckia TaxID=2638183 RepID=UPI0014809E5F|nr:MULTISPECIES: GntR family transcriptional regulator [unclassified Beijerinckia]MDH7795193.1 DNA-binding GntR family transcriptional regulator [Beijerinckia sp. GAS462]
MEKPVLTIKVSPHLSQRMTTVDYVAHALRGAIQSGELADGAELSQVGLAQHFGVSRVPVREALRALEAEGWIKAPTNQRAFVQALTTAEIEEIFRLRILIEPDVLRRAARNMSPAYIDELLSRCDLMESLTDHDLWLEANREFHAALLSPSAADISLRLLASHSAQVQRYMRLNHTKSDRHLQAGREHRQIVEAVRRDDLDTACTILSTHIERSRDGVLSIVKTRTEGK